MNPTAPRRGRTVHTGALVVCMRQQAGALPHIAAPADRTRAGGGLGQVRYPPKRIRTNLFPLH
jgi:hypothetical protein